jgi:hypothetical protein
MVQLLIVLEILQKPLGSTPYFLGRLREIESGKGTPFEHPTRYYYHRVMVPLGCGTPCGNETGYYLAHSVVFKIMDGKGVKIFEEKLG